RLKKCPSTAWATLAQIPALRRAKRRLNATDEMLNDATPQARDNGTDAATAHLMRRPFLSPGGGLGEIHLGAFRSHDRCRGARGARDHGAVPGVPACVGSDRRRDRFANAAAGPHS